MNGFGECHEGIVDDKKRSVGLLLVADIPYRNPRRTVILQRRGEFNQEKDWLPESWPGICQLTVHGRLRECEDTTEGLEREVREELGECFANALKKFIKTKRSMTTLNSLYNSKESVVNFGIRIDQTLLDKIRLHPSSGGLILLTGDQLASVRVLDPSKFDKKLGVFERNAIVMWPEELQAVKFAFVDRAINS